MTGAELMEPTPITEQRRKGRPVKHISGDGYTVTEDGETWYPHLGEWMKLRTTRSVDDLALILQAGQAVGGGRDETVATLRAIRDGLARLIIACEWSDINDNLLPSPPSADDLGRLDAMELVWLFNGGQSVAEQAATEKNDSAPTTDS
jgi:hypothetical protein